MTKDERAWRALEGAAKRLNEAGPSLLRSVGRELKKEAQRLGVRALDRMVSRFAGHPVHTEASAKLADTRPKALAEPTPEPRPSRPPLPRRLDSNPPVASAKPARRPDSTPPPAPQAPPVRVPVPVPVPIEAAQARSSAPTHSAAPLQSSAPAHSAAPESQAPTSPELPEETASWLPAERAAARRVASQARPGSAKDPLPALPDPFGIDRIVLLAGDSELVFTYWEIDPARLSQLSGGAALRGELRLLDDLGGLVARAYVDPAQGRQHLRIPVLGQRYRAELRLIDGTTDGVLVSESRTVLAKTAPSGEPAVRP